MITIGAINVKHLLAVTPEQFVPAQPVELFLPDPFKQHAGFKIVPDSGSDPIFEFDQLFQLLLLRSLDYSHR